MCKKCQIKLNTIKNIDVIECIFRFKLDISVFFTLDVSFTFYVVIKKIISSV